MRCAVCMVVAGHYAQASREAHTTTGFNAAPPLLPVAWADSARRGVQ